MLASKNCAWGTRFNHRTRGPKNEHRVGRLPRPRTQQICLKRHDMLILPGNYTSWFSCMVRRAHMLKLWAWHMDDCKTDLLCPRSGQRRPTRCLFFGSRVRRMNRVPHAQFFDASNHLTSLRRELLHYIRHFGGSCCATCGTTGIVPSVWLP